MFENRLYNIRDKIADFNGRWNFSRNVTSLFDGFVTSIVVAWNRITWCKKFLKNLDTEQLDIAAA